jgi:predicted nucleic acid-binding protein
MIVVDASAALTALLNDGPARQTIGSQGLHAPHLIDSEVASALRRQVHANRIAADDGWRALDAWRRIGVTRYPVSGLLQRIWELRDNLSAYDASYVAVAEQLDCALLTADRRLSNAVGLRCSVTVVPR